MINLFQTENSSLEAQWHENVCFVLPSFVVMEMRCPDEDCNAYHGFTIELGWLWGSLVFEYHIP